jgi:transcription elongation factor GreA
MLQCARRRRIEWFYQNAASHFQNGVLTNMHTLSKSLRGSVFYLIWGQGKPMNTSFLTRQGFQKLQDELDYLRTTKRQEVAARLHEAMEGGELIEDAEYEAAKNEQAFVEGRIQELEILLANARVIEENRKNDVAQVGAKITLQEDGGEPEMYTIVGPAEANPREGLISNESPLGRALIGHRANDVVRVDAPAGSFKVKIIKVE